ncbi:class II glutamine amidotransferase [Marivibrio halodurans]|uniref:Class II glutamine amidotransferase n=1 Tax=Marivibrio halodurans TaxID=2039722 RepID=A0A8J7V454_9PROT|nr:class II glutamine amidotransferase [Marivibrio halodurans]MBP5857314.1 class II glutamine amidotransferase [Marivibrio halodurans]
MCRWIAYRGRPIRLDSLVYEPIHSLVDQSRAAQFGKSAINADGFGVGWYGEETEPGLYRDILPAWSDPNLRCIARAIRSPLFFAHVRASTGTATSRPNCHPFGHGRWMMMHNGLIRDYESLRRPLDEALDDPYYNARLGTTDSEALFLLMLSLGLDADAPGAIRRAVAHVNALGVDRDRPDTLSATAAISDGRTLYVLRTAEGPSGAPPSLYYRRSEEGLTVVSEPLDEAVETWTALPPGSLLIDGPDRAAHVEALAV